MTDAVSIYLAFIKYLKDIGFEWNKQFDYHIANNSSSIFLYLSS